MQVNLSALLRGEINRVEIDCDIDPSPAPYGVVFTPGAHLRGEIVDSGGYIRLTAFAEVPYSGECARCLCPVTGTLEVEFNRTLVPEGMLTDEQLEEDLDEYLVIRRGMLDMDEALHEAVFLEFPLRLLCSPDCRGFCPHCGCRLDASGECGCKPHETDPRWDKLRELLAPDGTEDKTEIRSEKHGSKQKN